MARTPRTVHTNATRPAMELPLVDEEGKDFYQEIECPTERAALKEINDERKEILAKLTARARLLFTAPAGFEVVVKQAPWGAIQAHCVPVGKARGGARPKRAAIAI